MVPVHDFSEFREIILLNSFMHGEQFRQYLEMHNLQIVKVKEKEVNVTHSKLWTGNSVCFRISLYYMACKCTVQDHFGKIFIRMIYV